MGRSRSGCRFDQLHEDASGILRVQEVDPRAGRAVAGRVVQEAHALLLQVRGDRREVALVPVETTGTVFPVASSDRTLFDEVDDAAAATEAAV